MTSTVMSSGSADINSSLTRGTQKILTSLRVKTCFSELSEISSSVTVSVIFSAFLTYEMSKMMMENMIPKIRQEPYNGFLKKIGMQSTQDHL